MSKVLFGDCLVPLRAMALEFNVPQRALRVTAPKAG